MGKELEEDEIDLLHLVAVLWHKLWIIILSMLVCGGAALLITVYLIAPTYQASVLMYVNNTSLSTEALQSITSSDLTASKSLVDTYIVILSARSTLETVIEESGVDRTYAELSEMVSASAVNSTEIFQIVITDTNPQEAELLANTIAEVLPDRISDIVDGTSARIVDYAVVPDSRYSPSFTKNTLIGLLLGAFLSCAAIVLLDLLDDVVRDEDELMQKFGFPVLAAIPDLLPGKNRKGGYGGYANSYSYASANARANAYARAGAKDKANVKSSSKAKSDTSAKTQEHSGGTENV